MKATTKWLELKVRQYEHGRFEVHEALTGSVVEGPWETIRQWIEHHSLPETEEEINSSLFAATLDQGPL